MEITIAIEAAMAHDLMVVAVEDCALNFAGSGPTVEIAKTLTAYVRGVMEKVAAVAVPEPPRHVPRFCERWRDECARLQIASGILDSVEADLAAFYAKHPEAQLRAMGPYMFSSLVARASLILTFVRFGLDPELLRRR